MSDSVQPGTEVDGELWQRFREEVKRRRGGIRGHLRTEMENALRAYIDGGDATPEQVNRRLARIEAAVGVEATDGGTDTSEPTKCTHTPDQAHDLPDERPHPQSASEKKVAWLAECVHQEENGGKGKITMVHEDVIRDVVKDEYSFTADTARRYHDEVVDYFDLVEHPFNDVLYVTEAKREELIENRREQERETAQSRSERL